MTRPVAQSPVLLALVAHVRDVPAAGRERFADRVRERLGPGVFVIETCHRVEAYLVSPGDPGDGERTPDVEALLPDGGRILSGQAATRHAIAMTIGLDSVMVGEDQVLHQVRQALADARTAGPVDPVIDRLFTLALRAGRRARSWQQGPVLSLADLALRMVERLDRDVRGRRVLVVGAGAMGRLCVRAAIAAGSVVSVSSRTASQAEALAKDSGATAVAFDPGAAASTFDAVLVALRGPWTIVGATIDAFAGGGAVVVDLSVPAAVPGLLVERLGERMASADDLARLDPGMSRFGAGSTARLEALLGATTAEFVAWLDGRHRRAAAGALAERVEAERAAELADLWRRLPRLDEGTRDAIEGMTRHLAERILREPLQRLGSDDDGRHERAARELFGL